MRIFGALRRGLQLLGAMKNQKAKNRKGMPRLVASREGIPVLGCSVWLAGAVETAIGWRLECTAMTIQVDIAGMVQKLLAAAPAGSEVILFGSRATGAGRPDSDVDFLVIEPVVENEIREMARLRRCLKGSPVPIDVLVATPGKFAKWRDLPTSVYFDIDRQGRRFGSVG